MLNKLTKLILFGGVVVDQQTRAPMDGVVLSNAALLGVTVVAAVHPLPVWVPYGTAKT